MFPFRWTLAVLVAAGPVLAAEPNPLAQEGARRPQGPLLPLPRGRGERRGRDELRHRPRTGSSPARRSSPASRTSRRCSSASSPGTMPPPDVKDAAVGRRQGGPAGVDRRRGPAARRRAEARVRHAGPGQRLDPRRPGEDRPPGPALPAVLHASRTCTTPGLGDDELQTYRNALAKLVNSLSWHPKVRNPEPIDPHGTVFRIDLRWYMWDATVWNRVLQDYPYGVLDDGVTQPGDRRCSRRRRCRSSAATGSSPPRRGRRSTRTSCNCRATWPSWSGSSGSMPALNIPQERVMRVGFNGSGISKNNRVLERHDAVHGYYWRTYDFEEVPQNLADRGTAGARTGATCSPTRSGRAASRTRSCTPAARRSSACRTGCKATSS